MPEKMIVGVGEAGRGSRSDPRPALFLPTGRKKWEEEEEIRMRISYIRV